MLPMTLHHDINKALEILRYIVQFQNTHVDTSFEYLEHMRELIWGHLSRRDDGIYIIF